VPRSRRRGRSRAAVCGSSRTALLWRRRCARSSPARRATTCSTLWVTWRCTPRRRCRLQTLALRLPPPPLSLRPRASASSSSETSWARALLRHTRAVAAQAGCAARALTPFAPRSPCFALCAGVCGLTVDDLLKHAEELTLTRSECVLRARAAPMRPGASRCALGVLLSRRVGPAFCASRDALLPPTAGRRLPLRVRPARRLSAASC
jgi:hypothetical protein